LIVRQLVILGRDGVINQAVEGGLLQPAQLQPIPASLEAIARLNQAGIWIAVTVGPPGTTGNQHTIESLNAVHARLQQLLARRGGHIDGFFMMPGIVKGDPERDYAIHDLLKAISDRFSVSLERTTVVDSDPMNIDSALQTPAEAILIPSSPATICYPHNANFLLSDNLADVVDHLLQS